MMTHDESKNGVQALLFQPLLKNMISLANPLVKMADADRLLPQIRTSKQKLYSRHEPQVECICKGMANG